MAGWYLFRSMVRTCSELPVHTRGKPSPGSHASSPHADAAFREIHVATPAEVCESRDPKGHYAKARAGTLKSFTGIGNDYQPPTDAELVLDTSARSVPEATEEIEHMLARTGILFEDLVDLAANI